MAGRVRRRDIVSPSTLLQSRLYRLERRPSHDCPRRAGRELRPALKAKKSKEIKDSPPESEPTASEDEDEAFAPIAYLTNAEDEPAQVLQAQETERNTSEGLTRALDSLDARSRRIIEARWLREDDTATLHELADEFGVSAERIRQIESQAMKKMRGAMAPVMN